MRSQELRDRVGSFLDSLVVIALVTVVPLGMPDRVAAQTHDESTSEHHAESPAEEHHGKHHVALFIGATEAEEHHGTKEDPDFTLGLDYEYRLSKFFGLGGMFDWVVEGRREFLIGPSGFLHAYRGLKFYAATCYQKVREGANSDLALRVGVAWDFEINKYSISPHIIYDFAEEQNFLVVGVAIGRGF